MKSSKLAMASMGAALLASLSVSAKSEMKKAYMFGIAASFNDSTVYFTPVQEVDSVWFAKRNKVTFLQDRSSYSLQLRDYLEQQGEKNRTCAVFFGTNHKKLEEKWVKIHDKYTAQPKKKKNQKGGEKPPYQVKVIDNGEFLFKAIALTEETQVEKPAKKARKEKPGRPGGPGKPGGGPGGPGGGPGGQPPMGGGM